MGRILYKVVTDQMMDQSRWDWSLRFFGLFGHLPWMNRQDYMSWIQFNKQNLYQLSMVQSVLFRHMLCTHSADYWRISE